MKPLTPERIAELKEKLAAMHQASSAFYHAAVRIGVHTFIEFTGLMNEYIKVCHDNLAAGVDFDASSTHSGLPLNLRDYEALYLAEKFECIFGPTFKANPKMAELFWARVMYERPA